MAKSATDVMQEIIFSAVIDSLTALKAASGGVPNSLLRDVNAIHANATFADLPKDLQVSIAASVRAGFNRLLKEGYAVSPAQGGPPPRGAPAVHAATTRPPPRASHRPDRKPRPPRPK